MKDILDLDRYPLDQPDSSEWAALVKQCQAELADTGMFNLEGFMPVGVAEAAAADLADAFASHAFRHERAHNIYFSKDDMGLAPDHPALAKFQTSNDTLCWDQLQGTPMDRLYRWDPFARFLAAVMGKDQLHIMGDALAGLNAMSYRAGQALNWHFDRSEFTTTLLLQAPAKGGEFIYRKDLRSADNPNYDGVARLLVGDDDAVQVLDVTPGTLNVFRGKNTAHRVGDVAGDRTRVISVFSYFEQPDVRFSAAEQIGFYGRAG